MSEAALIDPAQPLTRWQAPVFDAGRKPQPEPPTAAQLEAIEHAAYEEGFARGRAEGVAAGAAEVRARAQRLAELLDHVAQPLAQLDAEVESALTHLAMAVARRLTLHELKCEPALIGGIVNQAIETLVAVPREVRVHLHPEDARLFKEALLPPPDVTAWRVLPDPGLTRGDCRISGETGWVDATLDTRIASIAQNLLDEVPL